MRALGRSIVWAWDHSLGGILKWLLIALIRIYQLTLSKLLMPSCRFHPSCSAYALGCVYEHGAIKGTVLSTWRLMRCNPWNGGGLDPVPEHGYWRPAILSDGRPRVDAPHENKN
jgi:putative membrane protein insertion efficiency factor